MFRDLSAGASSDEHDAALPLANGVVVLEDTKGSRPGITRALGNDIIEAIAGTRVFRPKERGN